MYKIADKAAGDGDRWRSLCLKKKLFAFTHTEHSFMKNEHFVQPCILPSDI